MTQLLGDHVTASLCSPNLYLCSSPVPRPYSDTLFFSPFISIAFVNAMLLRFVSLQNLHIAILMSYVTVLEGGAIGRCLSHNGGALMNGINAFMKEAPKRSTI